MAALRQARLDKIFDGVTSGKLDIARHQAHFLEALCAQRDVLASFDKLTAKPKALDAFQSAMFADSTVQFLNGRATDVVQVLQTPALADIAGGSLLSKVVQKVASPRSLLNAFRDALLSKRLSQGAQLAYSWLALQAFSRTSSPSDEDRKFAIEVVDTLNSSPFEDVKQRATALERLVFPTASTVLLNPTADVTQSVPWGRHDNDFADFREIAILPTAEEIACAKPPHLLTAIALEDAPKQQRPELYIENQFRLLREDMMYELREGPTET